MFKYLNSRPEFWIGLWSAFIIFEVLLLVIATNSPTSFVCLALALAVSSIMLYLNTKELKNA